MTEEQKEEQEMEVEALESIYMDDFSKESDEPLKYTVRLFPNSEDSGEENHVGVNMKCEIPAGAGCIMRILLTCCLSVDYPDSLPKITIEIIKGLSDKQQDVMDKLVAEQAEEAAGMAMIFTLAEALKEWLVENNQAGHDGSEYEKMLIRQTHAKNAEEKAQKAEEIKAEKAAAAAEDEDVRRIRIEGTAVTAESFAKWKKEFDAEMEAKAEEAKRATQKGKMVKRVEPRVTKTGRELFAENAGMVNSDEVDETDLKVDDEEETEAAGAVDSSLFEFADDDEMDDLDMLSDDDEED